MDIVDVVLAKALTPQGQIESYAATAQAAVTKANQAVNNINTITQQTNTNNQLAAEAVENANAAIAALNAAIENMEESGSMDTVAVDAEIKKLVLSTSNSTSGGVIAKNLVTTYPDNTTRSIANIVKYYKGTGDNEDGTMTQKAITAAIAAIPSGGGSTPSGGGSTIHLNPEDAGQLTVVDTDGNIVAGGILADDIANFLIKNDLSFIQDTIGLKIDYINKTFARTQDAIGYGQGADFDKYKMYGGRTRCNVADDGTITAFYGDNNYAEDGSNGQVMVYQPKFYYSRITLETEAVTGGEKIKQEILTLSYDYKPGFKIHPLFVKNGETLDYVLLSAYESTGYDVSESSYDTEDSDVIDYTVDKLSSIAGAKPISGVNKTFDLEAAEQMAQNRGENWHITTMAVESANQMLEAVEFGTLNGQASLESGITNISNNSTANCASNTGSTASLGNQTGYASSTTNIIKGNTNVYSVAGKRAISYRGIENPWGNIWRYIGDMKIVGNGNQNGGRPHIKTSNGYYDLTFQIPTTSGFSSGLVRLSNDYDWIFMPIEVSGNSALPIGDQLWTSNKLNGTNSIVAGGRYDSGDEAGPFAYSCDRGIDSSSRAISARLMFIPDKNSTYESNITKWQNYMEAATL